MKSQAILLSLSKFELVTCWITAFSISNSFGNSIAYVKTHYYVRQCDNFSLPFKFDSNRHCINIRGSHYYCEREHSIHLEYSRIIACSSYTSFHC